jgi:hypothetical protein
MKLSHEILLKEYLSNTLELDILDLDSCSLRFYYNFIKKNLKIPGDILELGVYRGKSLLTAALILKILGSKKKVYGFDTFQGFPKLAKFDLEKNFKNKKYFSKSHLNEVKKFWQLKKKLNNEKLNIHNISSSKNFKDTNLNLIKKKIKLLGLKNVEIIKGNINKTIPIFFKNKRFKLLACNIDVDLYEPYKIALPLIWQKLSKGGYIHLDEYFSLKFPGPKIACDEFAKLRNIEVKFNKVRKTEFNRCYIRK